MTSRLPQPGLLTFRQPRGLACYDVSEEDVGQAGLVLTGQQASQGLVIDLREGVVGGGEESEGGELGEGLLGDVGGLEGGSQGGELLGSRQGRQQGAGAGGRDGDRFEGPGVRGGVRGEGGNKVMSWIGGVRVGISWAIRRINFIPFI